MCILVRKNFQTKVSVLSLFFIPGLLPLRSYSFIKMADLGPPLNVRGMKKLNRELFIKTVDVPCFLVKSGAVLSLFKLLKNYLLKIPKLKPVRPIVVTDCVLKGDDTDDRREVLLNPKMVSCYNDITNDTLEKLTEQGIDESCFRVCPLQLTYDNWMADDVLAAVLPEGVETAASYSQVGHIVHLNLREHLHEYKHVIGDILLDKIKQARTVVNKVDSIDNTFRVFNMEVLAGEPDFVTEVKENYARFKFDFSKVYWNPRLCTEHERIVKKLEPGNVLYDVFAGVGPFSIPAAKKKCSVLANDLNPESFKWLQYNAKLNKVENVINIFNKDGAKFIYEDVKMHILQNGGQSKSHVVMNLPALATTFLTSFRYLFSVDELAQIKTLPLVHVYCFVKGKGDSKDLAKELVEKDLNHSISQNIEEITFVRNVAPNKDMMRVSFQLTDSIVLKGKRVLEVEDVYREFKKNR